MAYFSENLTMLVGKLESVAGTVETFTAADYDVKVFNPTVTVSVDPDDESAHYASGNHGRDVSVMGMQYGTISFSIKLQRAASVGDAPTWAKFAYASGQVPVLVGGTNWSIQPKKEYDEKTISLRLDKIQRGASPKAVSYIFAGCMGQMTVTGEGAGKPIMLNFTFSGKLTQIDFNVSNADILYVNNLDQTCYEKLLNATFTVDGDTRLIDSFTLDTGNTVNPLKTITDTTGIEFNGIVDRDPSFDCDPLLVNSAETTYTDYQYLFGSATGCAPTPAILMETSHFKIKILKSQLLSMGVDSRDGLSKHDLHFKCDANGVTGALADSDYDPEVTFVIEQNF